MDPPVKKEVADGPVPILPTGLSDEDDARQYLAQRFNGLFCPNCEQYWNREDALLQGPRDEDHGYCPECHPIAAELQPFGEEHPWRVKRYIDTDGDVVPVRDILRERGG